MTRLRGITGIVLAGGRSSRFGSPKLAVEIEGKPLLERAITAVAQVAEDVILAGSPIPDGWRDRELQSVADDEAFAGPLAGLSGGLRSTTTGTAIVVGGDMPGLVPAVLRAMLGRLAAAHDIDAVVLADPSGAHRQVLPLAMDVARGAAAAAEALEAGDRSLMRLLERLRVAEIPAIDWLELDPAGRTLLDIDRPSDVDRIRHELR